MGSPKIAMEISVGLTYFRDQLNKLCPKRVGKTAILINKIYSLGSVTISECFTNMLTMNIVIIAKLYVR